MASPSSDSPNIERIILTLYSIKDTIQHLTEWNSNVEDSNDYYSSPSGMQLLAANCTLITAIGEGINRINRMSPDLLQSNFPDIPWIDIVGIRNRIAHGYFELDAEIVFDAVKHDIPPLAETIRKLIDLCQNS